MSLLMPVPSTYISDPAVTHYVESFHVEDGSGIQGWYVCEFDAQCVAKYLKSRGHTHVKIKPINEYESVGIHPLVALSFTQGT